MKRACTVRRTVMSALFWAASGASALATPIVNGDTEEGFPSVVALGAEFGTTTYSACSGNLITPLVVLSAGHCGEGIPLDLVVSMGKAYFGTDVNDPDHSVGFADLVTHPDYEPLESSGTSQDLGANDIGILVLAEEAPVAATPIRFDEVTEKSIGIEMLSVGFGVTSAAGYGSGTKRSAVLTLDNLQEMFLISYSDTNKNDANICSGDSGGPQFVLEEDGTWVQWAVHSWGDQNCSYSSGSTRTDLVGEWILDQVEDVHGSRDLCLINGLYEDGVCDERCDEIDPDCIEHTGDTGAGGIFQSCGCAATSPRAGWAFGLLAFGALFRRRAHTHKKPAHR